MKKLLTYLYLLLGGVALSACSDSDFFNTTESNLTPSEKVAGIYQGKLYISEGTPLYDETTLLYATDSEGEKLVDDNGEYIPADFNVTLEPDADNSETIKLYNFVFNRLNLGTLTLHYVGIQSNEEDTYTAFADEEPVEVILGTETVGAAQAVKAKVRIDPTTSYIENGHAVIDLIFDWYKNGFEDEAAVSTYYIRYEADVTEEPVSPDAPVTPGAGPLSEQVAGTYQGRLNVSLGEEQYDESTLVYATDSEGNQIVDENGNPVPGTFNVTLDADGETAVTFGLYNFGFMGMDLGDIVLHNIPLEFDKTTGRITFGENAPVQLTLGAAVFGEENAIKATAKIKEETSYIENGHAFIDVEVVWYMSGFDDADNTMPIYVRYQGDVAGNLSEKVAGTYQGKLNVGLGEEQYDESTLVGEVDETGSPVLDGNGNPVPGKFNVTLDAEGETAVTFGLYNFGFMGMDLGDIVLHNIPLINDKANGRITFGSNPAVQLTLGAAVLGEENAIKATAKINEASSYIKDGHAFIDVTVVWYMGGFNEPDNTMPIYVRYEGDVQ